MTDGQLAWRTNDRWLPEKIYRRGPTRQNCYITSAYILPTPVLLLGPILTDHVDLDGGGDGTGEFRVAGPAGQPGAVVAPAHVRQPQRVTDDAQFVVHLERGLRITSSVDNQKGFFT